MILQALTQYYQRKADNGSDIAPQGFEYKQIPFIIVIDKDGNFVQLEDTRDVDIKNKKTKAKTYLVPLSSSRSAKGSADIANLLWDNYGYVLAVPKVDKKKSEEQLQQWAERQNKAFKTKIEQVSETLSEHIGISAVKQFYSNNQMDVVKQAQNWNDCLKIKDALMSFRLKGETDLICQSKFVQNYIYDSLKDDDETEENESQDELIGVCLVTGKREKIAKLHNKISGIAEQQTAFCSVNDGKSPAFSSYGKSQGENFPVGKTAMFEYSTALKTLLAGQNKFYIGDMTALCWSEKETTFENDLSIIFGGNSIKDNPENYIDTVKNLYASIHKGNYSKDSEDVKMHVLAFSKEKARTIIRLWYESTVADMAINIAQWFDDIRMVKGINSPYPEYMPLLRLLCNLVFEGKSENLPPNLVADTTKAILNGGILPITLLQMAIRRNRAEQSVTYARASLIKAYLNRKIRFNCSKNTTKNKEITVSYDPNRQDIGYVLGALFAMLEKVQEDSSESKINATIKDRYYGSASSTPLTVFATLIKLSQHHLSKISKIKPNRAVYFNRELGEIMNKIDKFPSHLNMEQQGLFAIGYYQKRQDFFVKKEDRQPQDADAKTNEI